MKKYILPLVLIAIIVLTLSVNATEITRNITSSSNDIFVYDDEGTWVGEIANVRWHVGNWVVSENKCGGGGRFTNITIPKGGIITSAYLSFRCRTADTVTTVNSRITGEDTDNASTFSTIANYQARRGTVVGGANDDNITTAQVNWDNIGSWTLETWYNSPDIKTIIQEIIDRGGWSSGNAIVLFWDDHELRSSDVDNTVRRARSYDVDGATSAPKLIINYTAHKWNTQTISKWNTKEIMKWNDLE